MKKIDFDKFAENYDSLLLNEVSFFSKSEGYFAEYKVGIARELCKKSPRRILEFGCGTGRNIQYLKRAFPEAQLHGSDISNKSLEIARANNPGIVFFEDGTPSGQNYYDLIFVAGVFHHIPPNERNEVLAKIGERLAPDGLILIFEHNPYNPITRKIVCNCPFDDDAVLLKASELAERMKICGFRVLDIGYALFFPPQLGYLARAEKYLRWLPLGGQFYLTAKNE